MQKGLPLRSFLAEGGQTQVLILAGIVILIAVAGGIFYLGRMTLPRQDSSGQAAPKPQMQSPVVTYQSTPTPTDANPEPRDVCFKNIGFCATIPSTWKSIERSYGIGGGIPAIEFECPESQNEDIYSRSPFDVAKYEGGTNSKLESIIFCSADACGFDQFGWTREDKVINGKNFIFINHNNSKDPLEKDVYYELKDGHYKFRFGRSYSPICVDKGNASDIFTKLLETFQLIN